MPELGMMLATDLVVLDHYDGSAILVANAVLPAARRAGPGSPGGRRVPPRGRPAGRDDHRAVPADPADDLHGRPSAGRRRWSAARPDGGYQKAVEAAKEAIRAGECFQIVLAQRFERPTARRPAGRLPGAAHHQPQPVHVPAALRRLRHRRLLAGGAPQGHRRRGRAAPGAAAPDRRHPAARRHARRRTPGSPPSCSPTRRSAPST